MCLGVQDDIFESLLKYNAIIGGNTDEVLGTFKIALLANNHKDEINQRIINKHIDKIDPKKLILWIINLYPEAKDRDNTQQILTNTLTSILEKHKHILNGKADKKKSDLSLGEAVLFNAVESHNAEMVKLLLQHKVKHELLR